jgi:hypothetical protein
MPVTIDVQRLRVRSLDVDLNEISWEIGPTSEDILDYDFRLKRSEGAEGPYEYITPEMEDQYLFIDNNIQRGHEYRQYFYRLEVRHKPSGDIKEFGPVQREEDPDLIGTELRMRMNLLMREFAGRRCWILPVRTFGQRCECWNETLGKSRYSGCETCFDTGFVRGYMSPIEAWVQIDPFPKAEQNSNVGPTQQSNTTARLGYYPPVKPRDILIEGENNRWRIVQVNSTQKHRAPVHQEVQLHKIPATDIEYKIPINMDDALKDIWLSPARNFTNPQNLEAAADTDVPDVFSIYPPT